MRLAPLGLPGLLLFLFLSPGYADTVFLKNGRTIHGKVVEDPEAPGTVVIEFGDSGRLLLPAIEVIRIESSIDAAEPGQPAPPQVSVILRGGSMLRGQQLSDPGAAQLVLALQGGGTLRIPMVEVTEVQALETPPEQPQEMDQARIVKTTYVVHLIGERIIPGILLESSPSQPLKLQIGDFGVLSIPRERVVRVEKVELLPPTPTPTAQAPAQEVPLAETHPAEAPEADPEVTQPEEPVTEPQTVLPKAEQPQTEQPEEKPATVDHEQHLGELQLQFLRELRDRVVDAQLQKRIEELLILRTGLGAPAVVRGLASDEILEIQFSVRELGRHRTANRVRAEAALIRSGPAVVPFLHSAAIHPFALTRRAVQRIVGRVGDLGGAPLAFRALQDPDPFVCELVQEALQNLVGEAVVSKGGRRARVRKSPYRAKKVR